MERKLWEVAPNSAQKHFIHKLLPPMETIQNIPPLHYANLYYYYYYNVLLLIIIVIIIYSIYRALIPNGPKAFYIIKITTKS